DGGNDGKINPAFDTRTGALAPFTGDGALMGVYRIDDLQVELWYDSVSANSSSATDLGSFQHFNKFRGWLVLRDCETGLFPALAGQGLGSTLWPAVDVSEVGNTFNTAVTIFGPTATIVAGVPNSGPPFTDDFTAAGNGGLALADNGGDIGAYFDNVVVPALDPQAAAFVYLEAAGFGTNNTGDPVYTDTVGYDMVVVGQALASLSVPGDVDGNGRVELDDADDLVAVLLDTGSASPCELDRADVNGDGSANGLDIQALLNAML
ncbi:MAG: dockerin type I domain-containing protein, partial [Planctomycetota bacterium]|nr:dockerin type I domain-containing protein [Planctomycetota bacterium]